MIIGKVLAQRALVTPDREAIIFKDKTFTFEQLNQRANRLANGLLKLGVAPGERVGLLMYNCNQFLETYFAVIKIGAVLVPLNIRLAPQELDFILNDCGVTDFIFGNGFDEKVKEMKYPRKVRHCISAGLSAVSNTLDYEELISGSIPDEPDFPIKEDDLHVIMYTSGTTGRPKGAMLTHKNMYNAGVDMAIGLNYRHPDRCLLLAPLFHSGSITPFVGHLLRGICTILMEQFTPKGALKLIEAHRAKQLVGVTAIMQMILQEPDLESYNLDSWKLAILPGSPLPHSLIKEAYERLGILCQNLWGMTEMCGPGSFVREEDILEKAECAGRPYFNVDMRIVGLNDEDLPPDSLGEIVVRGPGVMMGYWNRPEATAETIKDGWLYSGDIGKLDKDGYIYIIDRRKDMILSGGENVYPAEIERIIMELPAVAETAVIGVPDEKWGEVPKAFIVTREDMKVSPEEIIAYCRSKLAGYKVPKQVEYLDTLPRNPSGKVLKKNLRNNPA